jgi:hypothetical protein
MSELTDHREIPRGPKHRQANVAGEFGVFGREVARGLRDLLWMDEPLPGFPVETLRIVRAISTLNLLSRIQIFHRL